MVSDVWHFLNFGFASNGNKPDSCNCSDAIEIQRMGIAQDDEAMFSLNCNIIITPNKKQIEYTQLEAN